MTKNIFKLKFDLRSRRILFVTFFGLFLLVTISAIFTQKAHAGAYVYQVLQNTTTDPLGAMIKKIWTTLMDMVNGVIVIILIAVAFAEMLRLNVNTYGIKKILPTLIFAVIAANFSFIIVRVIVDLGNVSLTFFSGKTHVGVDPPKWDPWEGYTSLFKNLLTNLLLLVEAILLVILAILFLVRNWMLYFLAMVSGIAFMTIVLPQTKKLFDQWWTTLFKWTFMPLVSFMFLWLATQFSGLIDSTWIMGYVFTIACLVAAITMPFKLGGSVMSGFYKYTGMQAGIGYAKKNWLDPAVKEGQDFLKEKWLGQASQKYNPFGAAIRASFRTKDRRADQEKAVKGKENTAMREALGGKHDQFLSRKRQEAIAKRKADIESDFGEEEWKKKDIERKYRETKDGKKSALNSVQYKFRMEAAENNLKILENEAMAFAQKPPGEGENNPYYSNTKDKEHWRRMHDDALSSRSALEISKMTTSKFEEDAMQEMEGQAYLTDMALTSYRDSKKWLEELRADPEADAEEIAEAEEGIRIAKGSWDKLMGEFEKKYWDEKNGKFVGLSATIQKIIGGEDGKFHKDIDDVAVKSLAQSAGIDKSHEWMFNDRRNKRFSGIVKTEAASVKGKRTAEDSLNELENNGTTNKGFKAILAGDLTGLTEAQLRKSFAELDNAVTGSGDINNSSWVAVHSFIGKQQAAMAAASNEDGSDAGAHAREQLSAKISKAVGGVALNKSTFDAARKKALVDAKTADPSLDETAYVSSAAFKTAVEGNLKASIAKQYRVDQMNPDTRAAFEKHIQITIDDRGEADVKMAGGLDLSKKEEREQHAALLGALNEAIVNGTPRGIDGDGMRKYTAEARRQIPAGRREAGREMEDAYRETQKAIQKKKLEKRKAARAAGGGS